VVERYSAQVVMARRRFWPRPKVARWSGDWHAAKVG